MKRKGIETVGLTCSSFNSIYVNDRVLSIFITDKDLIVVI